MYSMKNNINNTDKLRKLLKQTYQYDTDDINIFMVYYSLISDTQKYKVLEKFRKRDYDFTKDNDYLYTKENIMKLVDNCLHNYDNESYKTLCKLDLIYILHNKQREYEANGYY